jgi:hypothetical protein
VAISITDFADRQTIGGQPTELVYTRVRVTNQGSAAVTVPAGQSGPSLVTLNQASDTVAPGASVQHDFAAAVDTFSTRPLPAAAAVAASAASYDRAFAHMASYWQPGVQRDPDGVLHLAVGARDGDQRRDLPDLVQRQPGPALGHVSAAG